MVGKCRWQKPTARKFFTNVADVMIFHRVGGIAPMLSHCSATIYVSFWSNKFSGSDKNDFTQRLKIPAQFFVSNQKKVPRDMKGNISTRNKTM
jgi:hypothetical protein